MKLPFNKSKLGIYIALIGMPLAGQAYTVVDKEEHHLYFDGEVQLGAFNSQETYGNADNSPSWWEGFIKYGLSGDQKIANGEIFGAIRALSSTTGGDGDASGATTGSESKTEMEDLFVGYRTQNFEFSTGSQGFVIGNGFIINNDALNLGEGLDGQADGVNPNRGGALWLAARKSFHNTAILRLGRDEGWRSDIYWLKSDNAAQASMEMAGINIENNNEYGVVGFLFNEGLNVDSQEANFFGLDKRDGQKTISLRYQGDAGIKSLFLSAQYVKQIQGDDSQDGKAWYAELGWTFDNIAWSPSLNYRFTRYGEGYDPLFYGFGRGYGSWFQGEVASNYSGVSGTSIDSDIHSIQLSANPTDNISVGALYFDISNTKNGTGTNDAKEVDLWMQWAVNDHLIISPLVGFYKPKSNSSVQGNDNLNMYSQVIAIMPF